MFHHRFALGFCLLGSCLLSGAALPSAAWADWQQSRRAVVQPTDLIDNGSFTQGLAGWTQGGNLAYTSAMNQAYDGFTPSAGGGYALLGPIGTDGTLTQNFADVAGQTLTISFTLAGDGNTPNDFAASFDGHTVFAVSDAPAQGWTTYDFTVTATGLDSLSFAYRDDPGYWALTNVSVTPGSAVPEPAALLPFAVGLAALMRVRRRRA